MSESKVTTPPRRTSIGPRTTGITRVRPFRRLARIPWLVAVCVVLLVVFVLAAFLGPVLTDFDPVKTNLSRALMPPVWAGGDWDAPFGTDQLGRNLLIRVLVAGQYSITVTLFAVLLSAIVGSALGLASGYLGRWVDSVLGRLMDAQLALPFIITALALNVAMGPGVIPSMLAIVLSLWVPFGRVVRAEAIGVRGRDYIALAQVAGLRRGVIVWRHVLPNLMPPILVLLSLDFGRALILESSLSFVGLGAQPPDASLGLMVAEARPYLTTESWVILVPAAVLAVLATAWIIVGAWVSEKLDPTLSMVK